MTDGVAVVAVGVVAVVVVDAAVVVVVAAAVLADVVVVVFNVADDVADVTDVADVVAAAQEALLLPERLPWLLKQYWRVRWICRSDWGRSALIVP